MRKNIWVPLRPGEKRLLIEALRSTRRPKRGASGEIDVLVSKLRQAKSDPQITVEVAGGMVQCASGNPFPIRICDYDIEGQDGPDFDAHGEPCRIWFEPPDPKVCATPARRSSRSKNHSRSLKR